MKDFQDDCLAEQYELYPYPQRDPQDEKHRLLIGSPSHLNEIEHWVFGGKRKQFEPIRILVAGCGTGDAAIMVAQQMARRHLLGTVVCLDRAQNVLSIVKERAKIRNLNNLEFIQGSILDLPNLSLGLFDYIDCCGVLHHLPNPGQGLSILKTMLAPRGGIGLMVYAPYGRTGVYMLQKTLSYLTPLEEKPARRLHIAKKVMQHLPSTAWLRFNNNFSDHILGGEAGLYDLLLNPRDVAYTIDELWTLVERAGFKINALIDPVSYDPYYLIADPIIRAKMNEMDKRSKAIVSESFSGNMATHVIYISHQDDKWVRTDPCEMCCVPYMREVPVEILINRILPSNLLPHVTNGLTLHISLPTQAKMLLSLIDGKRNLGEIFELACRKGLSKSKIMPVWRETFLKCESINQIFVRSFS